MLRRHLTHFLLITVLALISSPCNGQQDESPPTNPIRFSFVDYFLGDNIQPTVKEDKADQEVVPVESNHANFKNS